jgi:ribosomal-protein-alanine N-acetyltransferase
LIENCKLVKMEKAHLNSLAELERVCFSQPWSREGLAEELENPLACFVVSQMERENGIQVIGYAGMHCVVGECYITNVAVFPPYRRQGVAKALVQYLIDFAKGQDGEFISLEVRNSNENAIALYERLGFRTVGVRRNFYSAPTEDGRIMTIKFK